MPFITHIEAWCDGCGEVLGAGDGSGRPATFADLDEARSAVDAAKWKNFDAYNRTFWFCAVCQRAETPKVESVPAKRVVSMYKKGSGGAV